MRLRALLLALILIITPGILSAREPSPEPLLRLNTRMHFSIVKRVSADSSGQTFLTCGDDKTAKLWNTADGSLIRTFRVPSESGNEGRVYACALSSDGKTAAIGGWTGYNYQRSNNIFIYNTSTGSLKQRLAGMNNVVNDLEFRSDGFLVAALGRSSGIRIFKRTSGGYRIYKHDKSYGDNAYNIAFDNKGRMATVSYDGNLRLYDSSFNFIKKTATKDGRKPYCLAFSRDGRKIAVGYEDSTKLSVYDGDTLNKLYSPNTAGAKRRGAFFSVAFDYEGNLVGGGMHDVKINNQWWFVIRKWTDYGRGSYRQFAAGRDAIADLKVLPDDSILTAGARPDIGRYKAAGGTVFYKEGETSDFRNTNRFDYFTVNSNGSEVTFKPSRQQQMIFNINSRELKMTKGLFAKYSANRNGITVTDWRNTYSPKINGKSAGCLSRYEISRSVDIAPDNTVVLGADWNIYAMKPSGAKKWTTPSVGAAWAVKVTGNGKLAVVEHGDGCIRWYRLSDGTPLLSLYVHPDEKRWVLYTPDGYYDASPGADRLIGWHINHGVDSAPSFYPVAKFVSKFYRPDVIDNVLKYRDVARAVTVANMNSKRRVVKADIKQMLPPGVSILSPSDGAGISKHEITIRYKIDNPTGEKITDIKFLIDGRPLGARALKAARETGIREITLNVPERDCEVSVIAENRFSASDPASIRLKWQGDSGFRVMPKLYVLSIGVSDYADKALRLDFAAKDASDFAQVLVKQKGKLYRDVQEKVLTNKKATKGNILDALDWILRETTQKDVAMIFIAGHGVNDDYGNYYYLPENVNPEKLRRTGVSFADIKDAISNIAGKALFFIDTCHSGNVLGKRRGADDTGGIVNELASAENGVVVFASSTGRQFSLENSSWGNGAFTKALVEGLSGKAAYRGSRITLNMLDLYISERVKELTGGRQTPTTAKPNTISDFPVAVR